MKTKTKTKMKQMKTHWVADIFPLNEDDVDAIAEDIKANGQLIPIKVLKDGTIIDGRNRFLACQKVGVDPIVEVIEEGTDEEMLALSCSLNGKRRTLKPGQRAAGAAEAIERLYSEEGKSKGGRGVKSDTGQILTSFGTNKQVTNQCLTLLRNDKERFLQIKDHGSPVDPVYKEFQAIKAERTKIDNELRMIAQFEEIDERFQAGKIDRAEALVIVRGMNDEEERRIEEAERRINSAMSILKTISMLEKFNIDNLEEAFHRITDDNFANGFASGVKILAQLKK